MPRCTLALLDEAGDGVKAGVGSVLLLPELLSKPMREGRRDEVDLLAALVGRLDLHPADAAIARLATVMGSQHRLKAADAVHLATAVALGADRFITNNSRDFGDSIDEIHITFPRTLPDP